MQTLTIKCKPILSDEERGAIDATMEAFAAACNDAIRVGREMGTTSNVRIHHACYKDLRANHGLTANLAVRAIARAAGILKVRKRRRSTVRPTSIDYDARIFSFREADWTVSLSTISGRIRVPIRVGDYQKQLLSGRKPKSAVVWKTRQNEYYIGIHVDVEAPPPGFEEKHGTHDASRWIGVDLGIVNIATLDDGTAFSSDTLEETRTRYHRTRRSLQRKGTRGARCVLRRLSGKERRFQQAVNHEISRRIVDKAAAEGKGVRLEDLSGIRDRMRVRKSQRRRHHGWAFYDLRSKIEYKCALAGVPFEMVDPRYTSRRCPVCGHTEKANRKSQSEFRCRSCGLEAHADMIGAINISLGGAVNRPEVALRTFGRLDDWTRHASRRV
ncbi:transposase [Rhodocaloribacter litoris]|uniref:RNA-guided endonuclease InsQ/TnpB family protein n=1 Tax=Rhodocaloribacter litoris TaxID=2558931 RepID=UPI0014226FCA|nr:RNA-guided endonuclease TnpB family protein [Rhodocaloribacter litoris]QXD14577.1 transposase [Rhodocaloribacter litoris]